MRSALQAGLQGLNGAALTMVTKERDHAALGSKWIDGRELAPIAGLYKSRRQALATQEFLKPGIQRALIAMVQTEEDIQQREYAAIEADPIPHGIDSGIMRPQERKEIVTQTRRQTGKVIGGVADRAPGKVDDARHLPVIDEYVPRAEIAMDDRRSVRQIIG
ncbi:hypothetical protein ASE66_28795 [Bosea sp. Root483D1]|nr:hypothetical protein ASE66_28795 [Bosea sp. Root483D1]